MAAMDTWSPYESGGYTGGTPGGYAPSADDWGVAYGNSGNDINPQGAAADPFAYTQGSLLTPWSGRFSSSGYGGGASAPAFTPFNYGDFGYTAPSPGRFTEQYNDPAAFRFADFTGPSQFQAPTESDMKADPGYQARMNAAMNASKAAGANSGVLRTGGFVKGLQDRAQDVASQEYGNLYGRKASEWDREYGRAKDIYGINQGNTKSAFDTNTANRLAGYTTRQGAWRGNADVALQEGQLGYNIAQGTWDRNYQKARQGWEDEAQHNAQVAAAGAANASASYERDLGDYTRARDEFWTNQDRQYAILDREANRGLGAAGAYGNSLMSGYGAMGDYAVGAGDARAAGTVGAASAYGNMFGDIGNTAGGLAYMGMSSSPYNAPRMPGTQMGIPQIPR